MEIMAKVRFEGPEMTESIKRGLSREFVGVYNRFCDAFNPKIEAINAAYDRFCEKNNLNEDLTDPDSVYMSFFRRKEQEVVDMLCEKDPTLRMFFKRLYIDRNCILRAEAFNGAKMWFELAEGES